MMLTRMTALVAISIFATACMQQGGGYNNGYNQGGYNQGYNGGNNTIFTKRNVGTVAGGVVGGVLGSKIGKGTGNAIAIGVGTLLGAQLGASIGESLSRADMNYYNQTSQRALETSQPGETLPWNNPQSGNSGTVTPYNYYQTSEGTYCREYTQTINIGGKIEKGYGRACRQEDGSWRIAESAS